MEETEVKTEEAHPRYKEEVGIKMIEALKVQHEHLEGLAYTRELKMAHTELLKSLKPVTDWLKTIANIEADLKKKAKK